MCCFVDVSKYVIVWLCACVRVYACVRACLRVYARPCPCCWSCLIVPADETSNYWFSQVLLNSI